MVSTPVRAALRGAVVGGGTMGVGIAYVMATHGLRTTVVEPSAERVRALRDEVDAALAGGVARGRLDEARADAVREGLVVVGSVEDLPVGLDVIVESVPERADLKAAVLAAAEALAPRLLATNTSSMSVDALAAPLAHPERFCGLHFFNPVWSIGLVEVVRGARTGAESLALALDLVGAMGKESAVVNDSPGFATSRLDLTLALESIRMLEEGVAAAEDIDRAVRLAYRHPVGPLTLSDIVGLDVRLDISRQLEVSLGPRFAPPRLLEEMVAEGRLGRKSGRGFFDWSEGERS
ncbi:3-hydroxyacyl-CoA dehydrogenase family protein [Nocardioides sp. P86]|uniref:3-hydroxyacyl-CoA dehydrogenase family protein n=1 Tax=Nocardioides sp. P86 TaxID=2939569 RepID=UPI00203AF133|nr:3-hydroxyacyl-CoA dehydrogenase family protein [Nocardioides sp. P86]MCM3516640.1 3-hydroxyacyl-CoA dehydrogenase family protein [Nocardioides sp. P86]